MTGIAGSISRAVKRGVPGVPLNALDAIKDENTRLVLQSIVDGWHVRNGNSGDGDGAFVTRAEIDGLVSAKTAQQVQSLGSMTLTPGEISRALSDLQSQVFETQLFKDLEKRVDLIDKPGGIFDRLDENELALINETNQRIEGDTGISTQVTALGTRIGTAEAAIKTEVDQRVNADNALQTTINTQYASVNNSLALQQASITTNANNVAALTTQYNQIQASVGDLSAALAEESQVRADADGTLYAQWTLRVDVNGRVSGFGLASNANSSDFIVRADRFSIAAPSGPSIAPRIPFIVLTTTDSKGNPPGVYMDSAVIKNADIVTAKIGDAAVNTLKIGGNAVTVSTYTEGYVQSFTLTTSYTTVCSTSISISGLGSEEVAGTIVTANVVLYENRGDGAVVAAHIFIDGIDYGSSACTLGESKTITVNAFANLSNGSYAVLVRVRTEPASGGVSTKPMTAILGYATIMSGKR